MKFFKEFFINKEKKRFEQTEASGLSVSITGRMNLENKVGAKILSCVKKNQWTLWKVTKTRRMIDARFIISLSGCRSFFPAAGDKWTVNEPEEEHGLDRNQISGRLSLSYANRTEYWSGVYLLARVGTSPRTSDEH